MSSPSKDKPRLTEQEKKNNHIASEQKRRQAIREGFDRLANTVPGMEGQGRSESLVLNATIEYMKQQIAEYKENMQRLRSAGVDTTDIEIANLDPPEDDVDNTN
jgi:heteromeric Ino2p/Ino4p transcription factor